MGSEVHILVLSTNLLSGMQSLKLKLIFFLAVARFIEAGPQLDGIMKDVNEIEENPAPPEVYPASEEDPTPEVDPATEEFSSNEAGDMSKSRKRRGDIDEQCYADCLKEVAQGKHGLPCDMFCELA